MNQKLELHQKFQQIHILTNNTLLITKSLKEDRLALVD